MKVTGETFSLFSEGEGAEEIRCQNHSNFQAKGPLPDRTTKKSLGLKCLYLTTHYLKH